MKPGRRRAVACAIAALPLLVAAGCEESVGTGPPASPGRSTTTSAVAEPSARAVRFGVWGDTPYSDAEAALLPRLIEEMNAAGLAFSVNIGDIQGGGEPCADAVLARTIETFNRFSAPLVYVPGDNEWTDCHRTGEDPIERLAHLRRTMYPTGRSFGQQTLALAQQRPQYPEHSRWTSGSVAAIGLHATGSNNNHVADAAAPEESDRTAADRAAAEAEFQARDRAAVEWLVAGVDAAITSGAGAVVVFLQADPRFDVVAADRAAHRVDGFDRLLAALVEQAARFSGPVVVVHGDSHRFRHDQPLVDPATGRPVPNVFRVETYGSPLVGWVEVTVDPSAAAPVQAEGHPVLAPLGR